MTFTPCLPENTPNRAALLNDFCQQHEGSFIATGEAGLRLHYCFYANPDKPLLVIAPGRMEAAYKYRETAMDFWHQGYEVLVIDHRGQGLSQRFFKDADIGHMDCFDKATLDLITITKRCQKAGQPAVIAGHSMGASIALRAMQLAPELFQAVAIIAPMLSLPLGMPVWCAKLCSCLQGWLDQIRWRRRKIVPGYVSRSRQEYHDPGFEQNKFSSSRVRYQAFRALYQQQPQLQLGGPSAGWLYQALKLMNSIQREFRLLQQPVLMITAGQEQVVTRSGQDRLRRKLMMERYPVEWLLLDQARHEIFEERDEIRSAAFNAILKHFEWGLSGKA